ncbi:MAG: L-rhamnose mutarotase, partial [Planctomycetota bacterium]
MKKIAYTIDLQDDPKLIEEYLDYHRNVWPEV